MALSTLRTGPEGDARRFETSVPNSLADRVKSIAWYHTIDLPGGVRTAGAFDHRDLVPHYGLPDSLAGQRVLDVGTFDLGHVGDLLLHLENPMRALRAIRGVTRGRAMIVDCFDPTLGPSDTVRYLGGWENVVWTLPSLNSLAQMIADAGFANVELKQVFYRGANEDSRFWHASLIATP